MNNDLTIWFSQRPQWLQIAATRLLEKVELTDKDVSDLASICQQEANGKLPEMKPKLLWKELLSVVNP